MNVRDIIDLAKSGYKVSEIKELLSLGNDPAPEGTPDPAKEEPEGTPDPAKEEPEGTPDPDPEIDYKAKYEALVEENRKKSLSRDISGKGGAKTPEDIVKEAFRNIM